MFTSRELNTFISVAEKMSIKLAAEELNITSPAVCSMIKKLESRINNKLFIFEHNKMILTQYGKRIYSLTEGHFHTLRSLELKMRGDKDIIKVFICEELSFLSSFITNQFNKIEKEIILTTLIDDSTDLIINDVSIIKIDDCDYSTVPANLYLYLANDVNSKCKDIFIHKDHAHLIKNHLAKIATNEIGKEINTSSRIIVSENITSIVEMVISSLGSAILPHICSVLKCLANSRLEIKTKRIPPHIPMHVYAHKRIDHETVKFIFDDIKIK
ncbi:hypothetical protein SME22J_25110 [Serratia marcescens]|nr:hypothetical protein SME22J_25110 [Serratia marcescens]